MHQSGASDATGTLGCADAPYPPSVLRHAEYWGRTQGPAVSHVCCVPRALSSEPLVCFTPSASQGRIRRLPAPFGATPSIHGKAPAVRARTRRQRRVTYANSLDSAGPLSSTRHHGGEARICYTPCARRETLRGAWRTVTSGKRGWGSVMLAYMVPGTRKQRERLPV